ncbi:TetR/AcrR family transcriptional regulator [bacterium]|nr:TetR/AcrR family transcriptional regulator [bacterium]
MTELRNDIREIILKSAQVIFGKFGFRKTTMEEIAKLAHKAKSSLYHYFTSKEEIFKAIVEKEGRLFREEILRAISLENTTQKKLRTYFVTRMHMLQRLGNFYSAIKDEYFEHYAFIERLREQHDKEEAEIIKEILNKGIEAGEYDIVDPEITAFAITITLKGLEYSWIKETDISKTEKNIDNLLEILFYGLVKR